MIWQCTSLIGPHSEPVLQSVEIRNYSVERVVRQPFGDLASGRCNPTGRGGDQTPKE